MSIVYVHEKNTTKGTLQLKSNAVSRQYVRYFEVKSDSITENPVTIMFAADPGTGLTIPVLGAVFSADNIAMVTQVQPTKREDSPYYWDVEVDYDEPSNTDPNNPGGSPTDPTQWMMQVEVSWVKRQIPCEKDINNKSICNSANEPYMPPPNIDREDMRIAMTLYLPYLMLDDMMTYNNTINSTAWCGIPVGQGKLSVTARKEKVNNEIYYQHTFIVEVNTDGWALKLIDKGLQHLVKPDGSEETSSAPGSGDKVMAITDANGMPVRSPMLLNGAGGKLAAGANPVIFPANGYDVYTSKDWGTYVPTITNLG